MARTRTTRGGPGRAGAISVTTAGGSAAVLKVRNRSLTIMRGTAANAYGDESDVGTPLYTGIPAALAETTDVVFDAATQRQQIVRSITCTVDAWVDVLTTDTLIDETSGLAYEIESMEAQPGIGYYPARKTLSLRERSGVSTASD